MKKWLMFISGVICALILISSCNTNSTESNVSDVSSGRVVSDVSSNSDVSSESNPSGITKISVECGVKLESLINDGWKHDSVAKIFGESIFFRLYHIYDDGGVKVRFTEQYSDVEPHGELENYTVSLTGNVENLIFSEKFTDELFNGITMKSSKKEIINLLGVPHFQDESLELFGYRNDDFYAFFTGGAEITEVSIYPIYQMETLTALFEEVKELCKESEYSQSLADEIASQLLKEYDFYNYSYSFPGNVYDNSPERSQSTGIAYYGNGIRLCYSARIVTDEPMVIAYGSNISEELRSLISTGLKDKNGKTIVALNEEMDLAFEHEKERLKEAKKYAEQVKSEGVVSPDGSITLHYDGNFIYSNDSGINVIYKNNKNNNITLIASPWAGNVFWLNDRYFIYGYSKNYLNIYDLQENKQAVLGNCSNPIEVKENTIKFDTPNSEDTISYSFSEDGVIHLTRDDSTLDIVWE